MNQSSIAFLFPGQGSQAIGMGKDLAERYPIARQTFEEADAALGFKISVLCFEGPEDQLRLTENTQPAILTVSVAAWRVLNEKGIHAALLAGHSLGEYSAHIAAGTMSFADAVCAVLCPRRRPGGIARACRLGRPERRLRHPLAAEVRGAELRRGPPNLSRHRPPCAPARQAGLRARLTTLTPRSEVRRPESVQARTVLGPPDDGSRRQRRPGDASKLISPPAMQRGARARLPPT